MWWRTVWLCSERVNILASPPSLHGEVKARFLGHWLNQHFNVRPQFFSLPAFPLQEARWDCGMPGISPGSSGDSPPPLLPRVRARAWTTSCWDTRRPSHCYQLWLLLRTSPQAIVPASGEEKEACSHKQGQTPSDTHTCTLFILPGELQAAHT